MRSDREKNKVKVLQEFIKDPLKSMEEIGNAVGINKGTVSRIMPELQQEATKVAKIQEILESDLNILKNSQKHLERITLEGKELDGTIVKGRDLTYIGEASAKRYSLLAGNATDEQGGLNINIVNFGDNTTSSI